MPLNLNHEQINCLSEILHGALELDGEFIQALDTPEKDQIAIRGLCYNRGFKDGIRAVLNFDVMEAQRMAEAERKFHEQQQAQSTTDGEGN